MESPVRKAFKKLVGKTADDFSSLKNNDWLMILVLVIMFILIMVLFAPYKAEASELIDMHRIMMIESSGNPLAISKGQGLGLYQITPCVLKEYNSSHRIKISSHSLFNPHKNTMVAKWYLKKRIPRMLKHYHQHVETRNIIISYNAGISYVVKNKKLPSTTVEYLRKYGA